MLRWSLARRARLCTAAAGLAAAFTLLASAAAGSVSIAVEWDTLLRESSAAAVVTPGESRSAWEGGRIYTYTHARLDRVLSGPLQAGGDLWVRTRGGIVGDIGQQVEGEAVLTSGHACILFLHPASGGSGGGSGAYHVTARGQGQLDLASDDPKLPAHVVVRHELGKLLPRGAGAQAATRLAALAAEVVQGRSVDEVASEVAAAWTRTHGG
jgi:hypothetical protein